MRMNRSLMPRTLLAAMLGLGFIGLARAGDAVSPKPVSGVMSEEVSDGRAVEEGQPRRLLGRMRSGGLKTRLSNVGCYGNFNDYSCGSLHSECQFIFGSCRTFYGEACLKGPPPSPIPGFDLHALGLDRPSCGCPGH
jgi:hypothetical protein